jgi:cephalosporin hydroxylase
LRYFNENTGGLIHKWQHYFDIYDNHFSRFRDSAINLLEFGVSHGGSLQMWKHYFGKNSKIYGVDINPQCKNSEEDQITIFIGDQSDKHFVSSLAKKFPLIDIVIDDGGHTMKQQINTFEILFPYVTPHGLYVC